MDPISIFKLVSLWVVPGLIFLAVIFAYLRGIKVFDTFVEGAKEGFDMSVRLIPFLVGMMVAIGLLRDSGAIKLMNDLLSPLLETVGLPADLFPLAIMRPISGSSALAITTDIMNTHGPDSLLGRMASTMQGSTDTTLFVLTVYFGAAGIKKTRHALPVGLAADLAGILTAVFICNMVFG